MKRFSKEELKKDALRIAKAHKVPSVFATEDGNYFLPNDKSSAIDHNVKVVKKQEGFENAEVIEFKVEEDAKAEKPKEEKPKAEKPKKPKADEQNPPAEDNAGSK